jgi:hypothetical protein
MKLEWFPDPSPLLLCLRLTRLGESFLTLLPFLIKLYLFRGVLTSLKWSFLDATCHPLALGLLLRFTGVGKKEGRLEELGQDFWGWTGGLGRGCGVWRMMDDRQTSTQTD